MKKYLVLILALTLVASSAFVLASCGNTEQATTTVADTTVPEETVAPASEDTTVDAAVAENTEAAESTEAGETTEAASEAAKAPATTEEIVAYFNTAVNKVKTDAKSITRNYSKVTLAGETQFPGIIDGAMKLLGGADNFIADQLDKQSKGSETFTGKAAIQGAYPVENETWASKLTAADVKSATCTEKDGKYTITIVTLPDGKSANVTHGQGHAPKAFNVVLPGVVNDNVPKAAANLIGGEAQLNYPSSKATIVVDVATGNVVSADYALYWTINFGDNIVLPFLTSDSYTVKF